MHSICIQDETYIYTIPHPLELLNRMSQIGEILVITTLNKKEESIMMNTQECKQFFIQNPLVFEKYLEKIMNDHIFPDNFYMYIENILNDIRHKHLEDSVDKYWQKILSS